MITASNYRENSYAVPAVDYMLDIVEYLAEQRRPYGITELSKALEIPTNSVFRILKRLAERGYVELDSAGGYQLGVRFLALGLRLSGRFELRQRARRHLEWLARETGETAQVVITTGVQGLVLDVVNAPQDYFLQIVPGSQTWCHASAFGKCVLAFMDPAELQRILPAELPRLTVNTLTSRQTLITALTQVRKLGIAYDREEYCRGIICVGAPVFGQEGRIAAGLGITTFAGRPEKCEKEGEDRVFEAAARLAHDIGYSGDYYERSRTR
jgi:DNA-binding IclR family transcriptional regulator